MYVYVCVCVCVCLCVCMCMRVYAFVRVNVGCLVWLEGFTRLRARILAIIRRQPTHIVLDGSRTGVSDSAVVVTDGWLA